MPSDRPISNLQTFHSSMSSGHHSWDHPSFQSGTELAPDLEWMLQSGQGDDEAIIPALVEDNYAAVYRLALAIMFDRYLAERVAIATLATALLESHRYSGYGGLLAWLFSITLDTCRIYEAKKRRPMWQNRAGHSILTTRRSKPASFSEGDLWQAVDYSLEEQERQALLLHAIGALSIPEIASVLKVSERIGGQLLEEAYEWLRAWPGSINTCLGKPDWRESEDLDGLVARSLQRRWPAPNLAPPEFRQICARVRSLVQNKRQTRRNSVRIQELSIVGLVIAGVLAVVGVANLFFADPASVVPEGPAGSQIEAVHPSPAVTPLEAAPGLPARPDATQTLISAGAIMRISATATPIATPRALSADSSSEEVRIPTADSNCQLTIRPRAKSYHNE